MGITRPNHSTIQSLLEGRLSGDTLKSGELRSLPLSSGILTREVLARRLIHCSTQCPLCSDGLVESAVHLFFECRYAGRVWAMAMTMLRFKLLHRGPDLTSTWSQSMTMIGRGHRPGYAFLFMSICWQIWPHRNNTIFRGTQTSPEFLAVHAVQMGWLWIRHC